MPPGTPNSPPFSASCGWSRTTGRWRSCSWPSTTHRRLRGRRTVPAHRLAHPRGERWIEGVFGLRARAEGNGTGYETIAASGAHACVLHWIRNDGPLDPGQLLLLDAGVETDTLYTADITRTLPLSGRFSPVQRQVYELVLAAQDAGIAALRPGASFRDFHRA